MFEVMGGGRRMGPKVLADLLVAFAQLVEYDQAAAAFTARKLAGVFDAEGQREDEDLRAAKAEALQILRADREAAGAAVKAAC